MKFWQIKEQLVLGTLVFETLGQPEKEREFKIKSLKKWGLDLIFGTKGGQETYFTVQSGSRKVGETFTEGGEEYKVVEILKELPKNKKIYAHIEMVQGTAYLIGELREGNKNIEIIRLQAAELLIAFLKKHKLAQVIEALRNVGTASELVKHKGEQGKPYPYEELPPIARRFLREAKDVEKEAGFGRLAFAYFGENKDGIPRYWFSWLLPTIALFDLNIAQDVDKALAIWEE